MECPRTVTSRVSETMTSCVAGSAATTSTTSTVSVPHRASNFALYHFDGTETMYYVDGVPHE